ncbi:MAG: CinA family protein [Candidatus Izemoplasmatales bacterium]
MKSLVENVNLLAKELVHKCIEKQFTIVFAESMTGGLLANLVTSVPDASKVLSESFVVYSEEAKEKILHCKKETINQYSVYSQQVIIEMIEGLKTLSNAHILVSVSGIAGPKTYKDIDIGSVYMGIEICGKQMVFKEKFQGSRQEITYKTCEFIFKKIISNI